MADEKTHEDLIAENMELQREIGSLRANCDDQVETSATFQQRNSELETHVLQHLKARRQAERLAGQLQNQLAERDKEIALLKSRQPDKPDLMGSASAQPLTMPSELPEPPVAEEPEKAPAKRAKAA